MTLAERKKRIECFCRAEEIPTVTLYVLALRFARDHHFDAFLAYAQKTHREDSHVEEGNRTDTGDGEGHKDVETGKAGP